MELCSLLMELINIIKSVFCMPWVRVSLKGPKGIKEPLPEPFDKSIKAILISFFIEASWSQSSRIAISMGIFSKASKDFFLFFDTIVNPSAA